MGLDTPRRTLDAISTAWLKEGVSAILGVATTFPDEVFYAAAFHLFYADYSSILCPALGLNSEARVTDRTGGNRWSPADWHWPVLDDATEALQGLYGQLSSEMTAATEEDWDVLIEDHDEVITQVSKAIATEVLRSGDKIAIRNIHPDFVTPAIDCQRDGAAFNELIRQSVDPSKLRLFVELMD